MEFDPQDVADVCVDAIKDFLLGDLGDFVKTLCSDVIQGFNKDPELTIDNYLKRGINVNFKTFIEQRLMIVAAKEPVLTAEVAQFRNLFEQEKIKYVTSFLPQIIHLFSLAKKGKVAANDLVDFGFFLRELSNLYDEARKECLARMEVISAIVAWHLIQEERTKLSGSCARAYPDAKVIWKDPKPGSPEEKDLINFLGLESIPPMTKFRYKETADFLRNAIEEGREIPDSLDASANPTVRYRRISKKL